MAFNMSGDSLCELSGPITYEEIMLISQNFNIKSIVLSGVVLKNPEIISIESWKKMNDIIFSCRKDISLTVHNFYLNECDLSFLEVMSNVQRLKIGGGIIFGFANISKLKQLKYLDIVIPDLAHYEFLNHLSPDIEKLHISSSSLKRIDLNFIGNLRNLRILKIEAVKYLNIDVISKLNKLEELSLNSISIIDINFVIYLKELWALKIINCGVKDLSSLTEVDQIKYLSLYRLKGITNLDFVAKFVNLQNLEIESATRVERLPKLSNLKKLRRVVLMGINGISDFDELAKCRAIEELFIAQAKKLRPQMMHFLTCYSNLKIANIVFTNSKDAAAFKEMMKGYDIDTTSCYYNVKFVYN